MAKNILVTGGAGFIGSHLVQALTLRDHTVSVLDRNIGDIQNVSYHAVDITHFDQVKDVIAKVQPEIIVHLAALLKGDYTALHNVNVTGTKNIIDVFSGKLLFLSTGMVFQGNQPPYKEGMPRNPTDPYAITKKLAEDLIQTRPHSIIRASTIYGPGQTGPMFLPSLKTHLTTQKNQPFLMTKGEQKKDFLHVSDLISALTLILEKDISGEFNIAYGETFALREVIALLKEERKDISIDPSLAYRPNEIMDYAFDITKAKTILGWEPTIALREGLKDFFNTKPF